MVTLTTSKRVARVCQHQLGFLFTYLSYCTYSDWSNLLIFADCSGKSLTHWVIVCVTQPRALQLNRINSLSRLPVRPPMSLSPSVRPSVCLSVRVCVSVWSCRLAGEVDGSHAERCRDCVITSQRSVFCHHHHHHHHHQPLYFNDDETSSSSSSSPP